MKPASDGPAPPRRPSRWGEPSSSTRTPSDCSSTSRRRSSIPIVPLLPTAPVELVVVAPEHALLELLRDVADPVEFPVLAVEVRPRLIGAEEHAVGSHTGLLDLGQEPAG